jgi:hypothetical protein
VITVYDLHCSSSEKATLVFRLYNEHQLNCQCSILHCSSSENSVLYIWGKRLRLQFFQGDFFGGSPLNMFLQGGGKSSIAEAAAFFLRSQDTGKDRQALVPEDSQAGWCFFF